LTTPYATPKCTPPSKAGSQGGADPDQAGDEQYIWTSLVPRLVHPTKVAIGETLIKAGRPLSLEDLVVQLPLIDGNVELLKYHVRSMVELDALEVASTRMEAGDEVNFFFFPHLRQDSR